MTEAEIDDLITKNAKLIYANGILAKEVERLDTLNLRMKSDAERRSGQVLENRIMELESTLQQIRDLVNDE